MDAEAVGVGVVCEDVFEIIGIAMEIADDGFIFCKILVEEALRHFVVRGADGTIGKSVDTNKAEAAARNILFENEDGVDCFASGDIAYSSLDKDGNIVSNRIGMLTKDALQQEIEKIKS